MPPKIEGMPKHLTLLLHGENKLDDESIALVGNGLAHEQYLLGESFPLAGALAGPESDNLQRICIEPVHLHATRDHLVLLQLDPFQIHTFRCTNQVLDPAKLFHLPLAKLSILG